MHLPARVASSTSWSSRAGCTPIRRSPPSSASFIAILPFTLMLVNSDRGFRRTSPREVANTTVIRSHIVSSAGSGITVEIFSPEDSGRMFTIALPRDCGVPIGSL